MRAWRRRVPALARLSQCNLITSVAVYPFRSKRQEMGSVHGIIGGRPVLRRFGILA
jgi:hypothetical protein